MIVYIMLFQAFNFPAMYRSKSIFRVSNSRNIFFDLKILQRGWYIIVLASQSLTTLDLHHCKFSPLDLVYRIYGLLTTELY